MVFGRLENRCSDGCEKLSNEGENGVYNQVCLKLNNDSISLQ